jgi:hypothetical protein
MENDALVSYGVASRSFARHIKYKYEMLFAKDEIPA